MNSKIESLLEDLSSQGFVISAPKTNILERLVQYTELIEKWNKVHDLVSHKAFEDIFEHHVLDSLAAFVVYRSQQHIFPEYYLDIGSGAGLPGIVWHLLFEEEVKTILIEPRAKRVNFLKDVRKNLNLQNLEIRENRFKELPSNSKFVLGTLRALKPEIEMLKEFLKPNAYNNTLIWLASDSPEIEVLSENIAVDSIKYQYGFKERYLRSLLFLRSGTNFP